MIPDKHSSSSKPRPDINGNDTVQTVWIELVQYNLLIGGVYRRARASPDLEKAEFAQLSNQILKAASTGKKVLVLGDINIDHTNPSHKKAKEAGGLLSDLEAACMRRLPCSVPTWKSYGLHKVCPCPGSAMCGCPKEHYTSIIDNAYLSISETGDLQVLEDSISDHYPILVKLATNMKPCSSKIKTIYRRDISRLVVSDFEDALESKDWSSLYNMSDPNEALELLLNQVEEALDLVAPVKAIKIRPDKPKISLKRDTLDIMSARDKARKSGNHMKFKSLRNMANKLIKRDKIQGVIKRLKEKPGLQNVWQEAKTVLGRGRGVNLPDCTSNTNPNDTAEYQNKFFADKISRLVNSISSASDSIEDSMATKPLGDPGPTEPSEISSEASKRKFSFKFVTAGDVTRIIKRLKSTKAMGVDKIQTDVWKKGVSVLAGPIARICNLSLSSGIFPDILKQAVIHPVFKGNGKDPRDPGSYRPISILPSLSKIIEIVVRDALQDWLMLHGFIPESQFGFLPGRSVDMALACAQADWTEAKSRGDIVGILAFDLSAAFDTIDSKKLLAKLESAGISGTPLKWFSSYMSGRTQKVLWNDSISKPRSLTHGVPQGSILGPTLFLVMVADMPRFVLDKMPNARMTSYADDTKVYVHEKNLNLVKTNLEKLSNRMIRYCSNAGLVLNSEKTQLLVSHSEIKDSFATYHSHSAAVWLL